MTATERLQSMKLKDYIVVFFKGILLGLISVGIPGISASTIGIIVGIYFLMVEGIANIFKDFKHNFPFLIVLILGYSVGSVGAAVSITKLYSAYPLITTFAILGFLFGAIPDMVKDLKGGFKKWSNWLCMIIVIAVLIVYNFTIQKNAEITFPSDPTWGFLALMLGIGLITSATFVIPGVDFAVVFLSLGIYYAFTDMITKLITFGDPEYMTYFVANIKILGAYLIGYFVGIFLFSKLIKTLTKKYDSQSRFASLGFIVAAPIIVVKSCIYDNKDFNVHEITPTQMVVGLGVCVIFLWLTIYIMRKTHAKRDLDKKVAPLEESTIDNRWKMDRRLRNVFFHEFFMSFWLNSTIKKRAKKPHTQAEAYEFCNHYLDRFFDDMDIEIAVTGEEYITEYPGGVCFMGNHQGKNDALIVLHTLAKHPSSFIINDDRSHMFLMGPIVDYMYAKRIKFTDLKDQVRVYNEMAVELENGTSYVIFPEAMYNDNKNALNKFNTPCFMPAMKTKAPIVPFVLYDTWKSADPSIKGHLVVQVNYLKPIYYEEYKDLTKRELAELLRNRIRDKIIEIDGDKLMEIDLEIEREQKEEEA